MGEKNRKYVINKYNSHRIEKDKWLVTTEQGSWSLLSKEEYKNLRLGGIEEGGELYRHLEDRGVILTKDNIKEAVKKHAVKNHFLFSGTSLHIITPTLRCNQRCTYCHSNVEGKNKEGFDLDRETAENIVEFAFESPAKTLRFEFQGGEPLLRLDMVEMVVEHARKLSEEKEKEVSFSLVSNLTRLDGEKIHRLKELGIKVSTSLDGPEEVHNHNRKYLDGGGTYKDVVEKLNALKEAGIEVNALATVTQKSLDFPREIVDEYIGNGFDKIWLRPLNKIGFARENWNEVGYSAEDFMDFYKEALDYILMEKNKEIVELNALLYVKKILRTSDPNMTEMTSPCGAGISQLLYDFDGDIYTCDEAKIFEEFRLGNVKQSEWSDIFTNDTLLSMIDISSMKGLNCNSCVWEPFCSVCPVNMYSEQGTVVPKLSETFQCRLNKKMVDDMFQRLIFSKDQRQTLEKWAKEEVASK
ncbi:MAG: His-Xaa-Ser system radical SAM maturase HxsB [Candidatus Aenigmatarchaeota archaeon]